MRTRKWDLISELGGHLSPAMFASHILTIKRELRFNFDPVNQPNVLKDYGVGRLTNSWEFCARRIETLVKLNSGERGRRVSMTLWVRENSQSTLKILN